MLTFYYIQDLFHSIEVIYFDIYYIYIYYIHIYYNMYPKVKMILSNGNIQPSIRTLNINQANLGTIPVAKTSSSLNAPIISRIHNVKPGCGSCGRH